MFHMNSLEASLLASLGISLQNPISQLFKPLLLTVVLFAGPIAAHLADGNQKLFYHYFIKSVQNGKHDEVVQNGSTPHQNGHASHEATTFPNLIIMPPRPASILLIRNYLVAPLTEEFMFRGIILALLDPYWSRSGAALISSLLFGICHSHHYAVHRWIIPLQPEVSFAQAALQCSYTAVFGLYVSWLYYSFSGRSLLAAIVIHSLCNLIGFPDLDRLFTHKLLCPITVGGFVTFCTLAYALSC